MPHDLLLRHIPKVQKLTIRDQVAVVSVNNRDHLFGTFDGLLVFSQPLLRSLALGDVRYHAYYAQHSALLVEVRTTVSFNPDHNTVGTYHAIADLKVRLLRTKFRNRRLKSFSVVAVNHSQYFPTRNLRRLIGPENLGELPRAHDHIGGGIPLIGEHLSRLSRETKPFFALAECLLRQLALGNIDTDPDVTDKRAFLIKSGHSNVDNPSIVSVVASKPILHPELFTTIKGLRVRVQASLQIVGMNPFRPSVPEFGVHGSPGEDQPWLIEVRAQLVDTGHPDQYRRAIRDQAKTLVALLHRLVRSLSFSNVHRHS